jgi:glyoxylase-like metal-dependent hydrolase (beta-lactamase superfamily II)
MATAPAPDISLADHDYLPVEARGLTFPMGKFAPDYGVVHPLADGVGWTRLPVPGGLDHINVWLLDDPGSQPEATCDVAIVDTGLGIEASHEAWGRALDGRRVSRVLLTHYHPDHMGCAGWLCAEHDAPLWMNRTEYYLARMLIADRRDEPPPEAMAQLKGAGWTDDQMAVARAQGWGNLARIVAPLPTGHIRMTEGDVIRIGSRDWHVWIGRGHTPEHVCLVDFDGKMMIAGDQVLPRITSNVSLSINEPQADPLGEWLASIEKFRALPDDLLVLPAHGFPFTGLHARLDRLAEGHALNLDQLAAHLAKGPARAVDCFSVLFRRTIGNDERNLATGEALSHLRRLEVTGRAVKENRDGVWYYTAA